MSDTSNYIFRLSETIAQDFLKLGNNGDSFIQDRSDEILNKLEVYYKEEGCHKDRYDSCEKQFILKCLPFVSSVIQLNTTMRHFNDAMEQVEETYNLEDKVFEQAIKLSYLVFAYTIDKGYKRFSRDHTIVRYNIGPQKDNPVSLTREQLWKEIHDQVEQLLQANLTPVLPDGKHVQRGTPWYNLARRYAKQAKSKFAEINNKSQQLESICKKDEEGINEEEIKRITDEAERDINAALANLEEAISWDSQCKDNAKTDKYLDVIRDDPQFKKLIGKP